MPDCPQTKLASINASAVPRKVAEWLEQRGVASTGLLIGVSGGADSVGLLRAIDACRRTLSLDVCVAHLDHALRGESSQDADWVRELSGTLALPAVIERVDVAELASKSSLGIEETARQSRFDFFRRVAEQRGCSHVAVAHTADDQAETILHHVIRGTGLAGLRGIPEARPLTENLTLIRPLRDIRRAAVLEYLGEIRQDFCFDATNNDERLTRNRVRHTLLPLLRDTFNPQVADALTRLGRQVDEVQQCLERLASQLLQSALRVREPDRVCLDCTALVGVDRHLVREVLCRLWIEQQWPRQRMGFHDWNRLAALAQSQESSMSVDLPHQVHAVRRGTTLEIRCRRRT